MTIHISQPDDKPAFISFDELASHLAEQSHPSEIHGYLCGLFSAGAHPGLEKWLEQLAEQMGDQSIDEPARQLLSQLFLHTQNELNSGSLAATLLLPDDDEALGLRTQSLGIWCQSFISGFGQGLDSRQVSEMVEEVLRDFAEISLIETAEESEESEKLYVEVSEFVRLAWLNVYAEVCGLPELPDDDGSSGQRAVKQGAAKTLH
ncbi:UPF0149 family protein [Endozoicomonas acroporae]|uniref:UPF0149 family protein n=1 Tax=Endozoicomonas acroporae TaxID=1701104 RepID=UPI000C769A88|nr:UPF0149 family protein [Endozoicomonas acroporae]